jgi:hypothetical protein
MAAACARLARRLQSASMKAVACSDRPREALFPVAQGGMGA